MSRNTVHIRESNRSPNDLSTSQSIDFSVPIDRVDATNASETLRELVDPSGSEEKRENGAHAAAGHKFSPLRGETGSVISKPMNERVKVAR